MFILRVLKQVDIRVCKHTVDGILRINVGNVPFCKPQLHKEISLLLVLWGHKLPKPDAKLRFLGVCAKLTNRSEVQFIRKFIFESHCQIAIVGGGRPPSQSPST